MVSMDLDAVLSDRVRRSLAELGYNELNDVRCEATHDEVTLKGEVRSFYLKQVAQTIAMKVPGVRHLRNAITVTDRAGAVRSSTVKVPAPVKDGS